MPGAVEVGVVAVLDVGVVLVCRRVPSEGGGG